MKHNERELLVHRLSRIEGQLKGVKRALAAESTDCVATMRQVKAIRAAVKSFAEAYVDTYATRCAHDAKASTTLKREIRTIIRSAFTL